MPPKTHMHKQGMFPDNVASTANHAPGHDKIPLNDDPANCPICQQISHAGQFVAPAWLIFFLIVLAISRIEIATLPVPHFDAISHNWRSRGPPLN